MPRVTQRLSVIRQPAGDWGVYDERASGSCEPPETAQVTGEGTSWVLTDAYDERCPACRAAQCTQQVTLNGTVVRVVHEAEARLN